MKVSKRTEEARALNITRPHISLEYGRWDFYGKPSCKMEHVREAESFCDKLNKAKG